MKSPAGGWVFRCFFFFFFFVGEKHKKKTKKKPKKQKQKNKQESIPRDALFITHWPQALDAPGSEVIHELRIGRRRTAKMIFDAAEKRREVIFAHAQIVVMFRRRDGIALGLQTILIHFLENRLARCPW